MQDHTYLSFDTPVFMTYIVGKPGHSKMMSLQTTALVKSLFTRRH